MNTLSFEPLINDAMFHLVFLNNAKARKALVSVLLNIPEEEISEITVLNPMQRSDAFDAKETVLDLRLHLVSGIYLNIEMQVKRFPEWTNRTVVYSCRQITEQSNAEDFKYKALEPVIHIAIMNHTLFPDHKRFFTKYEIMDSEGYLYTDKLQFLVMDLKAISEASEEEKQRGLVEWAEAFTAKDWEQLQCIENPGVKEATKQMQAVMSNEQQRQMIWSRRLAQMDHDSLIDSAKEEGIQIGWDQGKTEGIQIGWDQGKTEGIQIGAFKAYGDLVRDHVLSVAEAAKRLGVSIDEFKKHTELSEA